MVLASPRNRLDLMPEGLPELTLGYEALAWAAKYLKHPNGKRAGQKWMFTREQARFVLWMYAVDENGDWLFYHFSRRLAKGSGKSPFAATMALVELLAPVRFKRFDPAAPGGCYGRPVDMPWVQIAAVSENQTANTMRMVRAMASKKAAPLLHEDYELDIGKTQINVGTTGKLEVITSSATSAEGAEVSFVVADELEHWLKSNGGHELHSTLVDNLTKSGSRMLETLNAWKPGLDSVAEEQFEAWVDQEEGRARNDRKILYDARIAPHGTDLADEDSLRSALEFVYADCPWADIDATITRIWHTKTKPDDAWRKYLNRPTVAETAWIDPADWALMERRDIVVGDGEEIVMFFDGSLSNDHTALVGCRMSDGHVFTLGVWEPAEEGTVDVDAVDTGVARAFDAYEVLAFFADVREWESFVKVDWPERYKDQIAVWAAPNGKPPEPIAWDMRGKDFKFTQACELVEMQISRHEFTHDGNDRLTEHVYNARRYPGRWGDSVRKESRKSKKKIDAAVCMIGARMVWQLVKDDPSRKKKKRSGKAVFV